MKIGFGICGSFCNHAYALLTLKELVDNGYDVTCFVTKEVETTSTRFGEASEFKAKLKSISKKDVVTTIVEAEQYGPKIKLDAFIVYPTTAVCISKLANGQYDDAVTLGVKAHLRNNRPVIIGISSNDLLGISATNLAKLLNYKYFYFIPFYQDDCFNKPKSLVADYTLTIPTLKKALQNEQIQPLLLMKKKEDD
jgi:dipicolinate synthase subunit B